ncbi:glycosyltransferase [Neptuniibacter sp. CAU 1671]|uniref:glycosyltransferase family 2 protein n=1 Tax=Neptuniibacter sp. CAU 1671 TaxID=3032593 RepID=UPI0023DC5443|nr:glycosyltransferase [Neptuniibacter sp. CAU 1671]MDF2182170.1 glycosyltransferase [Neptuniibacter sp. CAU 1671]
MTKISICICTCKRGDLLKMCLESLAAIQTADTDVSVVVIDNDQQRSAEALVTSLMSQFRFPLYYVCEEKRGIPCARNRAIREVQQLGSDYLIFIDDDEWVEPDWLEKLFQLCTEMGGSVVVSGGVVSELPETTPPHIAALFNTRLQNHVRGKQVEACATNNVLVPMQLIRQHDLWFDESKPLAGGTDIIFFKEASSKGVKILKCPEALVHEIIPESRTRLGWLSKRKYRAGITEAWRKQQNGRSPITVFLSAIFQVMVLLIKSLLSVLVWNRVGRNQSWLKACRALGVAAGVLGFKVDSYRKIDG